MSDLTNLRENRTSDYCCVDCGVKFIKKDKMNITIATFHKSICGVCGKEKSVTHIRHYNYLQNSSPKQVIDK